MKDEGKKMNETMKTNNERTNDEQKEKKTLKGDGKEIADGGVILSNSELG